MKSGNHDGPTRTRVRAGSSLGGRLIALVAGLGALLLAGMVIIGSIDPPPETPRPPTPTANPTPSPAPSPTIEVADRIYLLKNRSLASDGRQIPGLEAFDAPRSGEPALALAVDQVDDAVAAPDGASIYALRDKTLVALETMTLRERWRAPLSAVGGYQSNWIPPAKLALSPDGATLFLYRQAFRPNSTTETRAWIEPIAAADGSPSGPSIELPALGNDPRLALAADGRSLYILDAGLVSVADLETRETRVVFEAQSGNNAAALSPDGAVLYISDGNELITIDAVTRRELRRSAIAGVNVPSRIIVAPDGRRLAMLVATLGPPSIVAGSQVVNATGQSLALIDASDGRLIARAERPEDAWIAAAAFGTSGEDVYFAESSQLGAIFRWNLRDDTVEQLLNTSEGFEIRLFVGPAAPLASRPLVAPPGGQDPTPMPTPQVQSQRQPFAWLWPTLGASRSVTVFNRDGSRQTLADQVIDVIPRGPRDTRPPLLLRAPAPDAWEILDPIDGATTPLKLAIGTDSLGMPGDPLRFALAPDGARLAFVTHSDPDPGDDRPAPRQLVVIDMASGDFTIASDAGAWDQLYYGKLLGWADEGLYLSSTLADRSIGEDTRALWRIDPDATAPEPEQIFATAARGANIDLNAAAGLLLYEIYDSNTVTGTLHLIDLRGGKETLINENGPFVDRQTMSLSPDGGHVAYTRLKRGNYTSEVMLYGVGDGSERVLLENKRGGTLYWLPDGDLYHVTLESMTSFRSTTWRINPDGSVAANERALPIDAGMAAYPQPLLRTSGGGIVSFSFGGADSRSWIRLYETGDPPRLTVSLTLEGGPDQLTSADISYQTQIIYLP